MRVKDIQILNLTFTKAGQRPIYKLFFLWINTNIRRKYFNVRGKLCLNYEYIIHYFLILEISLIKSALLSINFENILEVIMKHDSPTAMKVGKERREGRSEFITSYVKTIKFHISI
jgi:hypothetical protein